MRSSKNKILTTHAGSLSRPANLIALSRARAAGENEDDDAYTTCLAGAVVDVVQKQRQLGIDIPDDGEFGKPVAGSYDYGAWWNYAFARMSGFSPAGSPAAAAHETQHKKSSVADLPLTSFANRRDSQKFSEFYLDPESSGSLMGSAARRPVGRPACTGPIKYTGHAALHADLANLKKAIAAAGIEEAFMCSIGPGSFARGVDLYYKTEEEFLFASADAMHEEYKAIVEAGIVLQIDDPSLPHRH
jgi:5-methyltetrahydropteroyltriglutamate--homocysteine methyltransferase